MKSTSFVGHYKMLNRLTRYIEAKPCIHLYRPQILWLAHSGEELDLPARKAPNVMTRDDEAHILQSFAFQTLAETINYPAKF